MHTPNEVNLLSSKVLLKVCDKPQQFLFSGTLSSLENMPAISLLHQGSPAGGFYGT
jgi:hypothetical protein